jgi:hypothetical protein
MSNITVDLSREGRHWTIKLAIDGQIQPRNIFGCSDGLMPLVSSLLATDAEHAAIFASTKRNRSVRPAVITIGMPSGRILTFLLASVQHSIADVPEGSLSILGGTGAGEPVD